VRVEDGDVTPACERRDVDQHGDVRPGQRRHQGQLHQVAVLVQSDDRARQGAKDVSVDLAAAAARHRVAPLRVLCTDRSESLVLVTKVVLVDVTAWSSSSAAFRLRVLLPRPRRSALHHQGVHYYEDIILIDVSVHRPLSACWPHSTR